jgi:glutamyl-tRNA reductase
MTDTRIAPARLTLESGAFDPRPLGLQALVTHARTVPSELREQFAAGARLCADEPRVMVVSTCHRAELYVVTVPGDPRIALPPLPVGGRRLSDRDAARHLFRVAAGLDSVVAGEDQILHQLRDCLAERHLGGLEACRSDNGASAGGPGRLDPVLERLFQIALHVGREARSWREGPPRSLAHVALDAVERETGALQGRTLLAVGAGRMGRLVALEGARRDAQVLVTNRSWDRARALAHDAGGRAVRYGEAEPLPACDAVVLAISAPWELGTGAAAALVASSVPVVDLSSPPSIARDLRDRLGSRYVSVDDLAHGPADTVRDRMRRRFERLLDSADAEFVQWVRARDAVPAIQALTDQAEARRAAELDRLIRRAGLDDHERELVEQMSHRLVSGILHAPLARLRDDTSGEAEQAARDLFGL